jgi:hypothetical protein
MTMAQQPAGFSTVQRVNLLRWLAAQLEPYGLSPYVLGSDERSVLRVVNAAGQVRFVACVPAPQRDTWAFVWSYGWALATDRNAVAMIVGAMA